MITKLIVGDDIKVNNYINTLSIPILDYTQSFISSRTLSDLSEEASRIFYSLYDREPNSIIEKLSIAEKNVIFLLESSLFSKILINQFELGMFPLKHQQWLQLYLDYCNNNGVEELYLTTCSDYLCVLFDEDDIIRL